MKGENVILNFLAEIIKGNSSKSLHFACDYRENLGKISLLDKWSFFLSNWPVMKLLVEKS